jgi:hypothetical protein
MDGLNRDVIGYGGYGYPGWPCGPFNLNIGQATDPSAPMPPAPMPTLGPTDGQALALHAHRHHFGQPFYGPAPGCGWGWPPGGVDPVSLGTLIAARQSNMLYWDQPNQGVDEFLGFECDVKICAGDTVDIQATPQIIFKPMRLIIPSTIGGQLVVRQLLVGNRPCFAGSGCIPGLAFAENSTYVKFNAETAWINQPITLTLTNISEADLCFTGCLVGPGAQPGNPRIVGGNP